MIMGQESLHLRVSDGAAIEVQIDKAKIETVGVIHIMHGMAEHFHRYDKFVASLNQQGYDVIRHHHRGHGYHVNEQERGHIPSLNRAAADAFEIIETLQTRYQDKQPYIVLGHSMGSLVARILVQAHPKYVDGLVLTGTPQYNRLSVRLQRMFLKLITIGCGKKRKMHWLNQLMYRSFNKRVKEDKEQNSWLSSNHDEVAKYNQDPYSGFEVSNQLIYEMMKAIDTTTKLKNLKKMKVTLPVLLIGGKEDPVNKYGRGVRFLGKRFKKAGIEHVTVHMYKHKRHEILFEEGYESVWQHLYNWLEKQILRK